MPTYEYACPDCATTFEVTASAEEKGKGLKPVCPKCGSKSAVQAFGKVAVHSGGETDSPECGPKCGCHTPGLSTKSKVVVCLAVALAAAGVMARGFMGKAASEPTSAQEGFSAAVPASKPDSASPSNATEKTVTERKSESTPAAKKAITERELRSTLWGDPLRSLASLNKVAVDKDAVFVLLPGKDEAKAKAIRKEIDAAARKITSRGTVLAAYTLDRRAEGYSQVTQQVPAPCVLAMVKGKGMAVAKSPVTEEGLLQAFVAASRPSAGCGPSQGCGPSGCP